MFQAEDRILEQKKTCDKSLALEIGRVFLRSALNRFVYGYNGVHMAPNGSERHKMALYGSRWLQMVPNCSKWLQIDVSMAPNGTKWLQMALNGSKWFHMFPNRPNRL